MFLFGFLPKIATTTLEPKTTKTLCPTPETPKYKLETRTPKNINSNPSTRDRRMGEDGFVKEHWEKNVDSKGNQVCEVDAKSLFARVAQTAKRTLG
jgi:hypothetical protein